MAETLVLRVSIDGVSDGEANAAAIEAAEALLSTGMITSIAPVPGKTPDGAKVAEAMTLGSVLLTLGKPVAEKIIGMLMDLFTRPGAPSVTIALEDGQRKVSVSFDPKRTSKEEVIQLARKLDQTVLQRRKP